MRKKVISIIVCMLLFFTVLPTVSSISKINTKQSTDNDCSCPIYKKEDSINNDIFSDYVVMENPPDLSEIDDTTSKPIPGYTPSEFSWRDYNGKDWTTPAKNQGNCGSCWAFAALSIFESMIKIREGCAEFNPDLSEQYVLSCLSKAGSCRGGSTTRALRYIIETTPDGNYHNGVVPESCLEYQADDGIPCSDKCENWIELLVPLLDYDSWTSHGTQSDRESIKTQIMETGPIAAPIKATDAFMTWGALNHDPNAYYPDFQMVLAYNHVIMILGWKDVSSIPSGGYWICKNSWGTIWGYDGYFNIAYGGLNVDGTSQFGASIISADFDPDSYDWAPVVDTGGSYGGYLNQEANFDASESIGVEGEIIDYSWDFGDDNTGNGVTTTHTYSEVGVYTVTLTITDSENNEASDTTTIWVQETNEPPNLPVISGPNAAQVGRTYDYTFSTTDPEGNDVWYLVGWGDEEIIYLFGPYGSGEEVILQHSWNKQGTFTIKAKAIDVFDDESDWAELTVQTPRNKVLSKPLFFGFFEKFLNTFLFLFRFHQI